MDNSKVRSVFHLSRVPVGNTFKKSVSEWISNQVKLFLKRGK